ncbi:unnamed protein product [Meloidogyne enterolobii]|uniref:Uncharacterized protein n=1 Tax=Meloidogyne enterolobii TaxID=390850 RepID=A0ACB0ZLE7_MELEN
MSSHEADNPDHHSKKSEDGAKPSRVYCRRLWFFSRECYCVGFVGGDIVVCLLADVER